MTWSINNFTVDINLQFYLIFYLVVILHEFGHIMAANIVGGNLVSVDFGLGNTLVSVFKININKFFFIPIGVVYSIFKRNLFTSIFFYMGGNILVLIVCAFTNILLRDNVNQIVSQLNFCSLYITLISMVPIKYPNGHDSDGLITCKIIFNYLKKK